MNEQLRIGDRERDATTAALAEHYAAGRLTREEFDHRAGVVVRARTGLDLGEVLADLPPLERRDPEFTGGPWALTPAGERASAGSSTAVARKARLLWRTAGLAPWAMFAVVFVVIWFLTGAGYFWPVWPIMGWGIGVAATGVLAHVLPEIYLERQRGRGRRLAATACGE
ncbi:DUF1707 domain-containing protein [Granulicoccus sp. GXG6511]|uniref:DUF1707 domain-containing protein n=1 Tax=Granulicoccus sp. GXG6511 TaxID=3381351 RepID=UPI003D7CE553